MTLLNTKVSGNIAKGGNGVVGANAGSSGFPQGQGGGNGGGAYGGGIASNGSVTIEGGSVIEGNTIRGGTGANAGRALSGVNGTNFTVKSGVVATVASMGTGGENGLKGGNGVYALGGGIASFGGTVQITGSTISGNIVKPGAGGNGSAGGKGGDGGNGAPGGHFHGKSYLGQSGGNGGDGGRAGDSGRSKGGGVYESSHTSTGTLNISASTISGNIVYSGHGGAAGVGGAAGTHGSAYVQAGPPPVKGTAGIPHSIFVGYGGGFYSGINGSATLSLVTIARNTSGLGAGIQTEENTADTIDNSTIVLNHGTVDGSVIRAAQVAAIDVVSSIITQSIAVPHNGDEIDATLSAGSTDNILTGVAVSTALGFHDHGTTETLLPLHSVSPLANDGTSNPGSLSTDQNGSLPNSSTGDIEPGSVWTTK